MRASTRVVETKEVSYEPPAVRLRETYINDVAGAWAFALAKIPAVRFERAILYPVADGRSIISYGA